MCTSRSSFMTVLYVVLTVRHSLCQDWTWLGGGTTPNSLTISGYPGGRSGAGVWIANGTVWLFGGIGFSDIGTGNSHLLNDVWSFNLHSQMFNLHNQGTWAVRADPTTNSTVFPSVRQHAAMCGSSNKIFVFGGFGEGRKALGDLWQYNTENNKWQELNLTRACSEGKCEELLPRARGHASVWCHDSTMYLFGGINGNKTIFSDMWKLDLQSLTWSKLHEDLKNMMSMSYPRGRNGAATWSSNVTLYMFGGNTDPSFSYTLQLPTGLTSDLWRYHVRNNTWQLVSDKVTTPGQHSHSVSQHSHSSSDMKAEVAPNSRISSAAWADSQGNLWLFGGAGLGRDQTSMNRSSRLLSDVWKYDVDTQGWTYISGSLSGETTGRYNEPDHVTETSVPGARTEMMVWRGGENLVYIFGGRGYSEDSTGYLNDLWMFDFSAAVSREYLITPRIFLSFFGLCTLMLMMVLAFALWSRQSRRRHGDGILPKYGHSYSRLSHDEAV